MVRRNGIRRDRILLAAAAASIFAVGTLYSEMFDPNTCFGLRTKTDLDSKQNVVQPQTTTESPPKEDAAPSQQTDTPAKQNVDPPPEKADVPPKEDVVKQDVVPQPLERLEHVFENGAAIPWKETSFSCDMSDGHTDFISADPFPPSFVKEVYSSIYGPLVPPDTVLDYNHYVTYGSLYGWFATDGHRLRELLKDIIPKLPGLVLELGPAMNPIAIGDNVRYIEIYDLATLRKRAVYPEIHPVEIDYVIPNGDLSKIPENDKFSLVVSSHVIEHQMDLVHHLQNVASRLNDGGYYLAMVPDKRFCYDNVFHASSIFEVLDDFYNIRGKDPQHKLKTYAEIFTNESKNDPMQLWDGVKGEPRKFKKDVPKALKKALRRYHAHKESGTFMDMHNYQFTPNSLAFIVDTLYELELIDLQVHRLYRTIKGSVEFGIILKKCERKTKSNWLTNPEEGEDMYSTGGK